MAKKLTPMMAQYQQIKSKYPDSFLFFRLGDFYEMFGDDAVEGAQLLDITLTARSKGENAIPMCGVPFHAAENYIARLTKLGKKVAVCEQVSDPSQPGIVQREVVRVVTPGTTLNDSVLSHKSNNFLIAVEVTGELSKPQSLKFALAITDLTTGEFYVTSIDSLPSLKSEVARINPQECIVSPDYISFFQDQFPDSHGLYIFPHENLFDPTEVITRHFQIKNLDSFGLKANSLPTKAAASLLNYLQETQKTDLSHIRGIRSYSLKDFMPLDEATLRNLELFETLRDHTKKGSLFHVIDNTVTAMGGRKLKKWLLQPLVNLEKINARLDTVDSFVGNLSLREDTRLALKSVQDIERLIARLTLNSGNARDLVALKTSLQNLPSIQALLEQSIKNSPTSLIKALHKNLDLCLDIVQLLDQSIADEPPTTLRDGQMIKEGLNPELDELRSISREGKGYIQSLQQEEIKKTGISSLKIKFNKVFGYYLEVSKSNLSAVPEHYIRKQTLVNAERYITPELKEYEEKVLGAEDKIKELEYKIFQEIRQKIINQTHRLQSVADILSTLDCLSALAETAVQNRYSKPIIHEEQELIIENGRHPVVEKMTIAEAFVPNNLKLGTENNQIALITGPNMGGKSTYLRQVALITLLAHVGSFIPASKAKIPLTDRIFTRVGAADNLVKGQSTFMVEMQEAANILHNATSRSLVILDEIGRGTSTYDGVSIAWSITEYLHDQLQSKTLFATHYHELISLAEALPKAQNLSIAVKECPNRGVIFLYKILPGGVDKSYGIEVAKLAGLPPEIISKSKEILKNLESSHSPSKLEQSSLFNASPEKPSPQNPSTESRQHQELKIHPQIELLKELDINNLTPLKALETLSQIQKDISDH